jgi:hypothetical protein
VLAQKAAVHATGLHHGALTFNHGFILLEVCILSQLHKIAHNGFYLTQQWDWRISYTKLEDLCPTLFAQWKLLPTLFKDHFSKMGMDTEAVLAHFSSPQPQNVTYNVPPCSRKPKDRWVQESFCACHVHLWVSRKKRIKARNAVQCSQRRRILLEKTKQNQKERRSSVDPSTFASVCPTFTCQPPPFQLNRQENQKSKESDSATLRTSPWAHEASE